MNLPVIFNKIVAGAKSAAGMGMLVAKKKAPEIMITGGLIGFVVTVIETVSATNKTNEIIETKEKKMELIQTEAATNQSYTAEIEVMDVKNLNRGTRIMLVKAWLPVVTTGVASVILILCGYRILNGRYVATAAAYKTLEAGFERYRRNVRDEFGNEVDWRMLNDIKAEDMAAIRKEQQENAEIKAQNKEKKGKKKAPKTAYQDITSQVFDQYSERWRRYWTPDMVWEYLVTVEREMQDKLMINKHLFLNEVYDRLGLPRTSEGAVVGWIVTRNNPHNTEETRVSFGLKDIPEERRREFLSETLNENIWLRLHFNPDGLIYNLIDKTDLFVQDRVRGLC